jgi:hypothetical protein
MDCRDYIVNDGFIMQEVLTEAFAGSMLHVYPAYFIKGSRIRENLANDCMDAGGTSPWKGEGRTMQEQLSGATHGAVAEQFDRSSEKA